MSYWICHWRNRYWKHEINPEGKLLSSSGSNMLSKRNVKAKDIVYVVSILDGILLLGGRMTVTEIVPRAELVRRRQDDAFYDAAEWAIAEPPGTRLDLHRALDADLTARLRFISSESQPKPPCFRADRKLDGQTTRGVRELTRESAELLDRIITITDRAPLSTSMRLLTEELLASMELSDSRKPTVSQRTNSTRSSRQAARTIKSTKSQWK
jgi:hypothetical protein